MLIDVTGNIAFVPILIVAGLAVVAYKWYKFDASVSDEAKSISEAMKAKQEYMNGLNSPDDPAKAEQFDPARKQGLRDAGIKGEKALLDMPIGGTSLGLPPTSLGFDAFDALGEVSGFAIDRIGDALEWFRGLFSQQKTNAGTGNYPVYALPGSQRRPAMYDWITSGHSNTGGVGTPPSQGK